jgi:signal peptidase II
MFGGYQLPLLYLRVALILALIIYTLFINKRKQWQIPLCMIIAGAIGNVIDYFLYGHVIDMIHVVLWGYDYPVFNVADSAIFLGIAALLLTPTKATS